MNKNELIDINIEDMTKDGEGIGHADGYTLFVKDAVIGDRVTARITRPKKTYAYARVEKVLVPSPHRIHAACPEARRCGGCRLQELEYPKQLELKQTIVENALKRIGGFENPPMLPIIGMDPPFRYRNKAQYPVRKLKDGSIATGFFASRTHDIIPIDDCLLTKEVNAVITDTLIRFMKKFGIPAYDEKSGSGLIRHLLIREGFATGEIMVVPVINGAKLPHADVLVDMLLEIPGIKSICLNINETRGNVILGGKVVPLYGKPWIEDELDGLRFRISPLSFYQVNPVQTVKLYRAAVEAAGLTGDEVVYDLYCGIGTISLFLSSRARQVYGVEIVPDAIRDAKINCDLNGITNVQFFTGAAEELVNRGYFDETTPCPKADVVTLDPPRKGCDRTLLEAVLAMAPRRIAYVSCDPATLARDLAVLCGENEGTARYRLVSVQPVDLFPQTTSVENVVRLEKV